MCNGCERDFNNMNLRIRYLCINCRPGKIIDGGFADYCFKCINDMSRTDPSTSCRRSASGSP